MFYQFKKDDAYDFARSVGIKAKERGKNLNFELCPYCRGGQHRDKGTFAIDLESGAFNCLRTSCGAHGNMVTLSRDFDFSLGDQNDAYYRPHKKHFRSFAKLEEPIEPKPTAIDYLIKRGISADTAKKYQVTTKKDDENVLVFTFFDADGKPTFIKYRKIDFVKGRDKCKEWCEPGCKPILYGMELCNPENPQLTLTEGQADCLALAESGIENCVSVPTGAKGFTWLPHCWDWLKQYDSIVIFGDYEKGKISLLDELRDRLEMTVLHVREECYKDCKDANELLMKYGKEAVREAVETAVTVPVERVIEMADVEDIDIYSIEKLETGIRSLDRTLYGGIPFGGVTIVTGIRGEGKSILVSQFATMALGAKDKQGNNLGYTCMVYSGELTNQSLKAWMHFQLAGSQHIQESTNDWGEPHYWISKANNRTMSEWYRGRLLLYDSDSEEILEGDEQESLVKTVKEVVMRNNARVIILDNLMTAIDLEPTKGDDKFERQSKFVKKLGRIARKFNVLIILVAHKRKVGAQAEMDENDAVSGSADITNLALVTIGYRKDKELPDDQRKLTVSKNRLFGKTNTDGWIMNYDPKSRRIYEAGNTKEENYPCYEFDWVKNEEGRESFDMLANMGYGSAELLEIEEGWG